MKKIAIICLLSVSAVAAKAQFRFGAEAGASCSRMFSSNTESFEGKLSAGARAGVAVRIGGCKMMAVHTGLYFTQKGANNLKGIYDGMYVPEDEVNTNIRVSAIELPVSVRFRPCPKSGFYFAPGVYTAVNVSARQKTHFNLYDQSPKYKEMNIGTDVNRMDFGASMALGYEFHNGLFIQAQGSQGLKEVFASSNRPDLYNNSFSITAGWMLFCSKCCR